MDPPRIQAYKNRENAFALQAAQGRQLVRFYELTSTMHSVRAADN